MSNDIEYRVKFLINWLKFEQGREYNLDLSSTKFLQRLNYIEVIGEVENEVSINRDVKQRKSKLNRG